MTKTNYRPLSNLEITILEKLLSVDLPEIGILREQISRTKALTVDENGSIKLKVNSPVRARIGDGPLVTATQIDQDTVIGYGPYINVLLFLKKGVLEEVDIYKDDSGKIINPIDPQRFDLIVDKRRLLT